MTDYPDDIGYRKPRGIPRRRYSPDPRTLDTPPDEGDTQMHCVECADDCDESYDERCREFDLPHPLCPSCWKEFLYLSPELQRLTAEGQL